MQDRRRKVTFRKNIVKHKLSYYAGHVMRGSSGLKPYWY